MKLMRLSIPAGWSVHKNLFYDVEPPGKEPNDGGDSGVFLEDIASWRYQRDPWSTSDSEEDYYVDLGWYPDQDPDGGYRLVLLQRGWDDIFDELASRDRKVICERLDRWFDQVHRARDRAQLQRWLARDDA